MNKAAFVILAAGDSKESLGRVVNALMGALEYISKGDSVQVVFDGAGTQAAAKFAKSDHKYNELFEKVRGSVSVCSYCADAFDMTDKIKKANLPLVDEFKGHPSYRNLIEADVPVLVF